MDAQVRGKVAFGFNNTHEMFRRQVRRFVQGELKATSRERAQSWSVPKPLFKSLARIGLLGMQIPKQHGGHDSGWVSFGIAVEELGRGSVADALLPIAPHKVLAPLLANRALAQEWLPAIVIGAKHIAFPIVDPDAGTGTSEITLTASRDADRYVLDGQLAPCWLAAGADAAVVLARTGPVAGPNAFTAFLVPSDLPRIAVSEVENGGLRASGAAKLSFDRAELSSAFKLGEEGHGLDLMSLEIDLLRVVAALAALGAASASLEEAIAYAKERTAFGQAIGMFEGVSYKIVENMTRLEAARLLCYNTLSLRDQDLPHSKQSCMCAWHCCELACDVIHDSQILFGNYGYSEEFPFAQRLRDVLGCAIIAGGGESARNALVREVLGPEYAR